MKLTVTTRATEWFQRDWGFKPGDSVRIFVRYGGGGNSFSLGLRKEKPSVIGISSEESGIAFFIDEDDIWYLDNRNLIIDYDAKDDDIIYQFTDNHIPHEVPRTAN